ncbi:MAG: PilZ domain-containing protein [Nitrospirae bacterium]|nr:PilZ domain-containing protein [Nitrospirota bacterium]
MERRAFERIDTNITARYFFGNMFYTGNILNISERGMLINTRRCLPSESMFVVIIRLESKLLKVVAKVRRLKKGNDHYDGMGVELLSTSVEYLDFIKSLKNVKSFTNLS